MAKTKKAKAPKLVDPIFEPGRYYSGFGAQIIMSDTNGHVWRIDVETGQGERITFKGRGR
jgi:hypothetical protein